MKMKISTMTKKEIAITALILIALLLLFPPFVSSECPKTAYNINELRSDLRTIIFGFLSNPSSSPYKEQEILDLLAFYKAEKDKLLVDSCDIIGTSSGKSISIILAKTIVFQKECNDGLDNDGDGAIDLSDAGCADPSDDDETNCGDAVCGPIESCSLCSADCGVCPVPAISIFVIKKGMANAASFNDYGSLILKGTLQQNADVVPTSDDEFIIKGETGPVAMVNLVTGNMIIRGSVSNNQASLAPPLSSDFAVKGTDGTVVSYIDGQGNLYLKGLLYENGNP